MRREQRLMMHQRRLREAQAMVRRHSASNNSQKPHFVQICTLYVIKYHKSLMPNLFHHEVARGFDCNYKVSYFWMLTIHTCFISYSVLCCSLPFAEHQTRTIIRLKKRIETVTHLLHRVWSQCGLKIYLWFPRWIGIQKADAPKVSHRWGESHLSKPRRK